MEQFRSTAITIAFWVFVAAFVWTTLEAMMLLHAAGIDPRPVPVNDKYFWSAFFGAVAVVQITCLFTLAVTRLKEDKRRKIRG